MEMKMQERPAASDSSFSYDLSPEGLNLLRTSSTAKACFNYSNMVSHLKFQLLALGQFVSSALLNRIGSATTYVVVLNIFAWWPSFNLSRRPLCISSECQNKHFHASVFDIRQQVQPSQKCWPCWNVEMLVLHSEQEAITLKKILPAHWT